MKNEKKKSAVGSRKGNGKTVLAFQDEAFEIRAKIGQGRIYSCINLEISNHGYQNDEEKRFKEIEMTLSYYQAKVLSEILGNFIFSKSSHLKAQTPVHVSSMGEIKWSGFPYTI
jgi:hypothetical protein